MGRPVLWSTIIGLALLAAACGEPPPGPGWIRATVGPVTVSPTPVAAGSTFTVSATVTDDDAVALVLVRLSVAGILANVDCQPDLPGTPGPGPGTLRLDEPAPSVTVVFTCSMPDYAPNGGWIAEVWGSDGQYLGLGPTAWGQGAATFEVVGGTDDGESPVVESVVVSPQPVVAGTPFSVTVDASDANLDQSLAPTRLSLLGPSGGGSCPRTSAQQVGPTTTRWVFACAGLPVAGAHLASTDLFDLIGWFTNVQIPIDVVPAA